MGHPGEQRLYHLLSDYGDYTKTAIKKCVQECDICARNKPQFAKQPTGTLCRSDKPWMRISVDFVGPKPSSGKQYLFTIIDEYSRFPFAFPVDGPTTDAAITCLQSLFSMMGPPSFLHSDRGTAFESDKFREFLQAWNITKSSTPAYSPATNGQCERLNSTLWKTIQLRLAESNLPVHQWAKELSGALSDIRTLPSRSLDYQTPHSKFFQFVRRTMLDPAAEVTTTEAEKNLTYPEWVVPGHYVYVKRHVRHRKSDPLVDKVRVIEIKNPRLVLVEYSQTGARKLVSMRHIARAPAAPQHQTPQMQPPNAANMSDQEQDIENQQDSDGSESGQVEPDRPQANGGQEVEPEPFLPRRSTRQSIAPHRFSSSHYS